LKVGLINQSINFTG